MGSTGAAAGRHAAVRAARTEPGPVLARCRAAAGRHLCRTWQHYLRWLCWTGCFCAWPFADMIRGPGFAALTTTGVWIAAPFAGGLLALRHAGRQQLEQNQAAWRRGEFTTAGSTQVGLNTARIERGEARIADLDQRVTILQDGLSAAFRAAGMTGPRHLELVREHATGPQ